MKAWLKNFLIAVLGAFAILIVMRALAGAVPTMARPMTLCVVVLGTCLCAARVWNTWPFTKSVVVEERASPQGGATSISPQGHSGTRALFAAELVVVGLLLLAWASVIGVWARYGDAVSRGFILRALAVASSVLVTIGMLLLPYTKNRWRSQPYWVGLLVVFWFSGTVLLPHICALLSSACYDIESFVYAVPGWSFLPLLALLIRRITDREFEMTW